jgi:hypothetical protein
VTTYTSHPRLCFRNGPFPDRGTCIKGALSQSQGNPHGSAYGVRLVSLVAKKLRRAAGLNGVPRKLACLGQRAGVGVASFACTSWQARVNEE